MELRSGNKVGAGLGDSDGGPALPEEVAIGGVKDCGFRISDCGFGKAWSIEHRAWSPARKGIIPIHYYRGSGFSSPELVEGQPR